LQNPFAESKRPGQADFANGFSINKVPPVCLRGPAAMFYRNCF
jgi:hypothetical protein